MNFFHLNNQNLLQIARENQELFLHAQPFPSIIFKNFFNPQFLEKIVTEFPDLSQEDGLTYQNSNEKKYASKGEQSFGENTKQLMYYLNSQPFLEFLQILTGIEETLIGDSYFLGGGLHEIKRGGLLKVHADFNKHQYTQLDRRINVLIYLNQNWKEEYGGYLEFWDQNMQVCQQRVLPVFNTLVIFKTNDFSYHGHPDPLACPPNVSRKSLALYYYSNGRPNSEINSKLGRHSTLFQKRIGHQEDNVSLLNLFNSKKIIKELIPPLFWKVGKLVQQQIKKEK